MSATSLVYRLVQAGVRAAGPAVATLPGVRASKLGRGIRGRRDAHGLLARWGREGRDPSRPVFWFHAPSVGEGLQARAVIEALGRRRSDAQVLFTHFSPSAEKLARSMPAAASGYLPWDLVGPMARVLEAVRPDALVFTKTEVWPVLVALAAARGTPAALVAATLPAGAGRLRRPARALLGPTWKTLAAVAAIAEEDGCRFVGLGAVPGRVRVTGDPGIDSAAQRVADVPADAPYLVPFHAAPRPTLVAGSTWPADEAVLLAALREMRSDGGGAGGWGGGLRMIVAPHEPATARVRALLRQLAALGWRAATLADVEAAGTAEDVDAVVVERVGVLAHLYTAGTVAYVGGGFHRAGLHSVLEPAAARLPVMFGPRHRNARAAADLLAAGGAVEVDDADALAAALGLWLREPSALDYAAGRAYGYIDAHRGAADRTAAILDELLARR
jgi:3-deoxy-D-manno-octulosonic-acid transferase